MCASASEFLEPFLNADLVSDLQLRIGTSDLLEWIEAEADVLSQLGARPSGYIEFTKSILSSRSVKGIHRERVTGRACIRPADNGLYTIYCRKDLPDSVARFAIAHELGHTLWFAPGGKAKPLSPMQSKLGTDTTVEYLCNRFAASLLLPRTRMRELLSVGASPESVCANAPLHLIPIVSSKFRIAERAVARRLFFEISRRNVAIVRIRKAQCLKTNGAGEPSTNRWVTSWCVFSDDAYRREEISGFRIPLTGSARLVPPGMIPDTTTRGTFAVKLDGRWWDALKPKPIDSAKIPFERLPSLPARHGYACRVGDRLYIAIPLRA